MDESDVIRARDVRTGRTLGEQFLESPFTSIEFPTPNVAELPEIRAERGPIRYQVDPEVQHRRAVERLEEQIVDAAKVPVHLVVADQSRTLLGTYDATEGSQGLARLLRVIADRLTQ